MEHMTAEQFQTLVNENENTNGEQILRNKVSSARGRAFEGLLMRGCNYYRQKEMAIINKVNEPYIVTKKTTGNKFSGRFTGRAEPDFKGVLYGGRAIAFEAKSTQKSHSKKCVDRHADGVVARTEEIWSTHICSSEYTGKVLYSPV